MSLRPASVAGRGPWTARPSRWPLARLGGVATLGAAGLLLAVTLVVAALPLFGMRLLVVLSGSMEPAIGTGDAVVVRTVEADEVAVGDVITYRGYGSDRLTTHRVTSVRQVDGQVHFRTRGDANASHDPNLAPAAGLQGRAVATLPGLGRVALALQRPETRLAGVMLPAAIVAIGAARDLVTALRPRSSTSTRRAGGARRPSPSQRSVAGGLAVVVIGAGGVAHSLATFTDAEVVGDNHFSTLAVTPPANVSATLECGGAGGRSVHVTWDPVVDAEGYEVLRATTAEGPYGTLDADVSTTSYRDGAVENGTTYHYVVRTVRATWPSANSEQASVVMPGPGGGGSCGGPPPGRGTP